MMRWRWPWSKPQAEQPLPLVLLEGYRVVAVVPADNLRRVSLPNWRVGSFFYKSGVGYIISLDMESDVWRGDELVTTGWSGDEHNVATYCLLIPGDVLAFRKIWDRDTPASMPQLRVTY